MAVDAYTREMDRGKTFAEQVAIQTFVSTVGSGVEIGLKDIVAAKAAYDDALLHSNFSKVSSAIIWFDSVPQLLGGGALYPEFDFQGMQIQRLDDLHKSLDILTFSTIASGKRGAAVFSWLGEAPACVDLIHSLAALSESELPDALVRFAFEYFENIFGAPTWWERLTESECSALLERFRRGMDFTIERQPDCLSDDGLRTATWRVTSEETKLLE